MKRGRNLRRPVSSIYILSSQSSLGLSINALRQLNANSTNCSASPPTLPQSVRCHHHHRRRHFLLLPSLRTHHPSLPPVSLPTVSCFPVKIQFSAARACESKTKSFTIARPGWSKAAWVGGLHAIGTESRVLYALFAVQPTCSPPERTPGWSAGGIRRRDINGCGWCTYNETPWVVRRAPALLLK